MNDYFSLGVYENKDTPIYVKKIEHMNYSTEKWLLVPELEISGRTGGGVWPRLIQGSINTEWHSKYFFGGSEIAAPFLVCREIAEDLKNSGLTGFEIHPAKIVKVASAKLRKLPQPDYCFLGALQKRQVENYDIWKRQEEGGDDIYLGNFPGESSELATLQRTRGVKKPVPAGISGENLPDLFFTQDLDSRGGSITCSPKFLEAIRRLEIRGFTANRINETGIEAVKDVLDEQALPQEEKSDSLELKIPLSLKEFHQSHSTLPKSFRLPCRNRSLDEEWFFFEEIKQPSLEELGAWELFPEMLGIAHDGDDGEYLIDPAQEDPEILHYQYTAGRESETGIKLSEFLKIATESK